jgi:hypothetical protein
MHTLALFFGSVIQQQPFIYGFLKVELLFENKKVK